MFIQRLRWAASKTTPSDACLLVLTPLVVPSHTRPGWSVWSTAYSSNVSLLRLGYTKHCSFHLGSSFSHFFFFSLGLFALGNLCHERPYGEAPVATLLSTAMLVKVEEDLPTQTKSSVIIVSGNGLTASTRDTQSQNTQLSHKWSLTFRR